MTQDQIGIVRVPIEVLANRDLAHIRQAYADILTTLSEDHDLDAAYDAISQLPFEYQYPIELLDTSRTDGC